MTCDEIGHSGSLEQPLDVLGVAYAQRSDVGTGIAQLTECPRYLGVGSKSTEGLHQRLGISVDQALRGKREEG
jgi:hypothetical protein